MEEIERTKCPGKRKKGNRTAGLFVSAVISLLVAGITVSAGQTDSERMNSTVVNANVIQNGDFSEADMSMWSAAAGGAVMERRESETAIYGDVTTYGVISNRTSPYQCFAQDITSSVANGASYEYEFYCMLSDDYEGAPEEQRMVEFAPYITVDGKTTYLGSWSSEITGTASQTLEPGVWTKYSGTFQVNGSGNLEQVVIRLLEQGTEYGQGDCVKGEYCVTGVALREIAKEEIVLEDVPALKDAVAEDLGSDAVVGAAVTVGELSDEGVKALVEKHFNAVTPGNELKPDALFGYSNRTCPGTETVEFQGTMITVPKLDFSRAEQILDVIYAWNQENPDATIQVRGHVLVWHSQTPEWFFHVDYDKKKPYVTAEEMDVRLEWYIKMVLEHFTGETSKYQGMFYGWDVVNEAVSDASGTYRSDAENESEPLDQDTHGSNSSWWHVYQSNAYIIHAFQYANQYAPESVKLFYNDYNECSPDKMEGILQLIEAVRQAEGTGIDGMGMQGHYMIATPSLSNFKNAMRAYCEAAGSVMITEWDMRASASYDGIGETQADEYAKQAYRYRNLYQAMVELKQEGYDIDGFTMWGTVDKYSWLQSSSGVGGGADGTRRQCPLLFDDAYRVKPAYWGIVDGERMEEEIAARKRDLRK